MIPLKRHNTWFVASLLCGGVVLLFGMAEVARGSDQWLHWFIIPVVLCGILAFEDAVKWLFGELDTFDPIGLLGLFGVHFFFLAPLLHLRWNYWIDEVVPPTDWRPWLGGMAALNLLGLLIYRGARGQVIRGMASDSRRGPTWRLRPRRFRRVLFWALLLAGALQLLVYLRYGGFWTYISAVEHKEHSFLGVRRIANVAESFPILAMMGYAVYVRWTRKTPSWLVLVVVLAGFFALKVFFGGLHGRRADVIFAVFWAVGIIHFCIRPVPRKLVLGGVAAAVAFAYLHGFYKSRGLEGLEIALHSSHERTALAEEIRRPIEGTLLGDMGRSDVQAFVLYRATDDQSDYECAFGRTYAGGALTLLPGPLWRDRPPTKVKEGTEALYGRGTYRSRPLSSSYDKDKYVGMTSRVFGLAGEAMLNFGPLAAPAAFVLLGVVVGCIHRWGTTWKRADARWLIMPFLVYLCLTVLIGDSDNVLRLLEEDGAFPFLVLFVGSISLGRPARRADS